MPIDDDPIPAMGSRDTYTVQRGDTLEDISRAAYGVPHLWHRIMNANKCARCRDGMSVGHELVIPR